MHLQYFLDVVSIRDSMLVEEILPVAAQLLLNAELHIAVAVASLVSEDEDICSTCLEGYTQGDQILLMGKIIITCLKLCFANWKF